MFRASIKTIYKRYFQRLFFAFISILFFLPKQSQAQCTSVSIYDRIVSGYHSTLAVKTDGKIAVWGEDMRFGGVNSAQTTPWDLSAPVSVSNPAIMGTVGGGLQGGADQAIFLVSDGLYALGNYGGVLSTVYTSSTNFQKILTPTGGDASTKLPNGIAVNDVANIFATYKTLLIVTKNDGGNANRNGQVWIITQTSQAVEANGGSANTAGSSSWKRVHSAASIPLTNIIASRGQISPIPSSSQFNSAFMALAANGDVYTWGNSTYLGDNSSVTSKLYATKMTLPSEFSSSNVPKMIGVTGGTKNVINPFPAAASYAKNSYYLLSNSGSLYALGDNSKYQCGDFTKTERSNWVKVQKSATAGDYFTDINFISVQEHTAGIPCASAITTDGKLYTWGEDDAGMLGKGTGSIASYDPGVQSYSPGIANGSDGTTALFCEMGGHTLMYLKVGSDRFCYVGHKTRGSMGDGTINDNYITSFDCTNTPQISICGSVPVAPVTNSSVVTASPTSIVANGTSTSTITVQLKNSSNVNLTTTGGVGVITTSLGTISSTVDNNDGTYTAILTSPISSGTATLGFNLSGITSSSTATVEFTPMVAPLTPGSINGLASSCPTTAGLTYSVSPVANAESYNWTVPTGWTITAGQGTYSITVTAGSPGQNGNITVSAINRIGTSPSSSILGVTISSQNSVTLSSNVTSDAQTVCINTAISSITYTTTVATGATITNLPTGVNYSWANNVLTISGTPTVVGSAQTYTINLTGGCGVITTTGTIAVTANNTVVRTSASGTDAQAVCVNNAIVPITYATTGATGANVTNLPTGVTGVWANNVITISGTPTVAVSAQSYTIALAGGCGVITTTGNITVDISNSVTRTSAPGTDAQISCINTAITPIVYATTVATGATVSNLPTGLLSNWVNNVLTISGTPSVAGSALTYTITLTGGCGVVTTTGTIEVTPNNTVTRTSAAGTVSQTVCVNSAITSITYTTTGATGASFSGLPTGVTGVWSNNVITISGSPTISAATQTYTVTLTGGCGVITTTGTIAVTANNAVTRTSAAGTDAQSVCINTAITPITYSTVGATGATVSNLPANINYSWSNNILTISGTPSFAGSALTYTITLTGGCGVITTTGTIAVKENNTISLSSSSLTNAQTTCINTAITSITYSTTIATGATVSNLPTGINYSWSNNLLTISGTPSVAGSAKTFTVNLTGGCGVISSTGTISVTANNTVTRTSAAGTVAQTVCINTAMTPITYSTTGATGATFSGLTAGVNGVWSNNIITISGTPTISVAAQTYTITLTGGCGVITTTGTITVSANNTATRSSAVATETQVVCINTAISNITYATTVATGANVSNLPSGVSSSWSNNILTISGTPTVAGSAKTYTVNLTGGCGVFTTTGTIVVTPNNTVTRTSGASTIAQTVCINSAITSITYSTTGATGATFSGLPAGVNGVWSNNTITISGTPTISVAAQTYTVTLLGGCGVITTTGTINVLANNTVTRTSAVGTDAQSVCANTAMTPIIYATTVATGATVTNLPSGITGSWSNNVLTISGTPTVVGTALTYTIALTGGCGVVTTTGTIAVKPKNTIALSSLTGTDNQLKCINTAINNITYNTTGATGANFTGLPVGVSGIWSNDAIVLSGSPSISGSFNYKISLIGGCAIADKLGDINVTPENTIALSSAATTDSQSICIGNNITTIEYTTVGATGFTITGLPTGVQAVFQSNKIIITGTPSVTGVFNYSISLAGGCGQVNKTGAVIINSLPTGTIAAANNGVICEGSSVVLTATGGNTYEWNLNGNSIAGAVAANYSASVAGLYSVKLISDKGCTNFVQQTATLVLNNAPVIGFSFDKYCINTPIIFTNSSTTDLSGPVTMLWDFGDNETSSSTSPTHSFLVEKTFIVKLTVTPTNCPLIAKSLSKNIKIEVPPLAIRYPNVFALKNTNTKLSARAIGKIYAWSPITGLSNASSISPNFNFTTATNYVIKITNDAGCIFNDSLNVLIFDKADFFVPNAFSPNNDGRNDKLKIAAPGIESFQYFRIFNRWGNLVFETSNSSIFWDGTFKGMAQPAEVYSWFAEGISASGNKIQRNGQTLILR